MGDFNEVRDISERFGSIFNKHGAEAFNSFIVNAVLVEVPLGGCSFTWCHKSAKKMSKLDRLLIFDNLMCSCPSISSTSLDRFLSDHRPIILREAHYDYGPIPFKFFHYCKFMNKLKYLKEKIRIWARIHKESLNSRTSIRKAKLADLDGVIDKGEGSDADGHRRREFVRLIQEVEKVVAMEVAQKSKIEWSIEGDENSKYYHGVLNKKRGRLTICGVLVDGIWMESRHLVKHEFFEHFQNRFEKSNKSRILLERDFVKRISLEQNDDLEREVSNEEIKRAVWDCGIDKAPGLDGFTFGFYRRPISLIGSLYKVIAKVLTNRLVTVLDDIVDEIQYAFVTDRQILDGPFILNEVVHLCKNKKKQSMIFKVDFEKAYDSVRWDLIDDILRRVVDLGLFNGIKLDSSLQISHLFYADDAIFMGQWSQCNIDTIIRVLDVFCRASGLGINMNKSNLMGISVDSNKVKHAVVKIDVGGLGVSSLFALNRALMFKWVWRFFSQKNSLWVRVVKALHGEDGKIGKNVQPRYPSTWLNIINEIESLKLHGIDLVSFITPKLGNGVNTSFWDVAWCGDITFKNLVSRLYALESMENIEVASKLSHGGLEFSFRRNPRGGVEQALFEMLKEMVEGVTLKGYFEDEMDQRVTYVKKLLISSRMGFYKERWETEEVAVENNLHQIILHGILFRSALFFGRTHSIDD
nr:hypothetical protein [Tanacetum cinerariifolium]